MNRLRVLRVACEALSFGGLRHRACRGLGPARIGTLPTCTEILLVRYPLPPLLYLHPHPYPYHSILAHTAELMRPRSPGLQAAIRSINCRLRQGSSQRCLMTLAIETSCDDTSVAIVEKGNYHGHVTAKLHFHDKVTSNNSVYQGVHPLVSLQSHQESLATLVHEAIRHLPMRNGPVLSNAELTQSGQVDIATRRLPDFISVTRGPGMRSNLFTGLDTAKGLAVAWQVLHAGLPMNLPLTPAPETSRWCSPHASTCSHATNGERS